MRGDCFRKRHMHHISSESSNYAVCNCYLHSLKKFKLKIKTRIVFLVLNYDYQIKPQTKRKINKNSFG
jgi:hypothetical protein